MKIINLKLENTDELLELEGQMYWQGEKWKKLWEKEASEKFKVFIQDYLTNFPKGCFGLVGKKGELFGAMFLIKISKIEAIPYLHRFSDYFDKDGEVAYVSFFVVREEDKKEKIAQELYNEAKKLALGIGCKKIAVVIYSSPLEEQILRGNSYKRLNGQINWEIYPGITVPAWIYYHNFAPYLAR